MMTITLKLTLPEANLIQRALEVYRGEQLARIKDAGGPDKLPGTFQDIGRAEDVLARDFNWTRPSRSA